MSLSVVLQYILPHQLLSRMVFWLTRWKFPLWKNFAINYYISLYKVDLSDAIENDLKKFPDFNSFFTRPLKSEARRCDSNPKIVAQPADGTISQMGKIHEQRIFQAKGHDYTVTELLGDGNRAHNYEGGNFTTVYLSPRDYHRVHMPLTGTLVETLHIPGRLFSVAPFTVNSIPRLFARNERLVCHFDSANGPFCVVMVGALLVSSVETVWGGLEIPPYAKNSIKKNYQDKKIVLERLAEMGRFNMGSTVILLFPPNFLSFNPTLQENSAVQVGQSLGNLN